MPASAKANEFVFKGFTVYTDGFFNQFYFNPDRTMVHILTHNVLNEPSQTIFQANWIYHPDADSICWQYQANDELSAEILKKKYCFTLNERNDLLQSMETTSSQYRVAKITFGQKIFLPLFIQKLIAKGDSQELAVFADNAGILQRHIIGKAYTGHSARINIFPDNNYTAMLKNEEGGFKTVGQGQWQAHGNVLCFDKEVFPEIPSFFKRCAAFLPGSKYLYQGQTTDIVIVTDMGHILHHTADKPLFE